ncbi:hypothetical protein FIV38_11300 [Pseudomonas proteolytica]|nr:hypothetical protein F4W61_23845 [Pseudomonas proteolytica]TWR83413.1 hypothetical protein FIV38_11300 [Pseudomonas proteolytica]
MPTTPSPAASCSRYWLGTTTNGASPTACWITAWRCVTPNNSTENLIDPITVGASLLARNAKAPRSFRMPALSLTIFASKLAPTGLSRLQQSDTCHLR